jgi:hypothetical protein
MVGLAPTIKPSGKLAADLRHLHPHRTGVEQRGASPLLHEGESVIERVRQPVAVRLVPLDKGKIGNGILARRCCLAAC